MAKIFDHAVIYNGVFYPANTPIEVKDVKTTNEKNSEDDTPKKPTKKAVGKNDKGTN